MPKGDTIVGPGTPPGESALAVVRLSGPACPDLAQQVLRRSNPLPFRRAVFGHYHDLNGEFLDEVVAVLFAAGHSFTGEDMLEVSCHGNPLISNKIIDDFRRRGCRLAEPGEFTRTAFLSGRLDLSQAEAVADMIQARSELALRAARQQLSGQIGRSIAELTDRLLRIMAHFEAYIDFPEEDLPAEDHSGPLAELCELMADLSRMIDNSRYRSLLIEGIRTVILGVPNAGKSSLINRITGEDRALVSPEPGTTRDYIRERIPLEEFCIQIMDTAGIRAEGTGLELAGMRKALEQAELADFYLLVLDSSSPPLPLPAEFQQYLNPGNALVLENKIDLPNSRSAAAILPDLEHVRISLKTDEGWEEFLQSWLRLLRTRSFSPPPEAVVVNARQCDALLRTKDALNAAMERARDGEETPLVVSELREAVDSLGEIVGRVDNERMLDHLFREFCIGK